MEFDFDVTENIAGNCYVALTNGLAVSIWLASADYADVGRFGRRAVMLNRTAVDGHFACPVRAVRRVEQDVCGRRRVWAHIAFDIAAGDVNVADGAGSCHDTAPA